jgi:hypothetical protein
VLLPLVLSLGLLANPSGDLLTAEELVASRRGAEALTLIEALQRQAPSAELDLLRIEALLLSGQLDQARHSLDHMGGRYPRQVEVHLERAAFYARFGDVVASIGVLQALQRRWPNDPAVAEDIGDRYAQFGAGAYLNALLAAPDQQSARLKLAGLAATLRMGNARAGQTLLPMGAELRAAKAEIGIALKAWADAWSAQDVAAFVAAYLPPAPVELEQPDGSRRLVSEISVVFTTPRRAQVDFVEADRLAGTERRRYKRVHLVRGDGRQWRLSNERVLVP